jgi:D-tyrosyl-tRNA(Tyr) deacylase
MRAVIQRVSAASVLVESQITGSIETGLLVLLGIHNDDTHKDVNWMAEKIINLRIFDDDHGLMNVSLKDICGQLLVVSQFTLFGDCRKGRRPSWSSAAPPEKAQQLYNAFNDKCCSLGISPATGTFQAMMKVSLTNDGPVTLLLDSHKTF